MARNRKKRRAPSRRSAPPPRARRLGRRLALGLAALCALALAGVGWLVIVYPKGAGPGSGREVRLAVRGDEPLGEVSQRLADAGVLDSPRLFAIYARLLGAGERMRNREVLLTDDMSPRDVLARIARGYGSATVRVTIPEGFDRYSIARRLARWEICEADEFIAATEDRELLEELGIEGPSAEGYLFPDTYRFAQGMEPEDVVTRLHANFERRAAPLYEAHAERLEWLEDELGWGIAEVLTLASIVEKEAAVADERPVIARVFINRLRDPDFRPKRLQADPAVSYGCRARPELAPSCAGFDGTITRSMLQDRQNPYNTYRHEGLPPGPICNPGLSSIEGVLAHEDNEFLYFVARGHGRHAFSATLEDHNAAVARYRAMR